MIRKNLLLCTAFVVACTSIMASEKKEPDDVLGKESTSSQQKVVVEDKKEESSFLQQMMLEMKKMREANQKLAEKITLLNQKVEDTTPKVDDKKVAIIPESTAHVMPPLEAPSEERHTTEMLKEDAKLLGEKTQKEIDKALPKAKEELKKVAPKVEKEAERVVTKVEKEVERVAPKVEKKVKKFFKTGKF